MTNKELADIFTLIADLMQIKGEVVYKILAYRKAAENLISLPRNAKDIWQEGKLKDIPGVGKAISEKMDELLSTGKLEYLERLKKEVPETLAQVLEIPDLGPKKVKLFWDELGITTVEELKGAAEEGKLSELPGMGKKSEERILIGIEALSRRTGRMPLGDAWPLAQKQLVLLREIPGVKAVEAAGSLRRMRSTVGDIDILVAADDSEKVMQAFIAQPTIARVEGQGNVKTSVEFSNGLRVQIWVHPPEKFGTALQYATGSKGHNVKMRELALSNGYSLSEQALTKEDGTELYFSTEEKVYEKLGIPWVAPELREDQGEVSSAISGALPKLIEKKDIIAELHCHSTWSDGKATIIDMALAAMDRGYKTLAITDHSVSLGIGNGLSIQRLEDQKKEIASARKELGDEITLLHGTEMEIKADGSLDFPDDVLAELDIVIASLHVSIRQPSEKVTQRMLNAINNPHVDIIAHPTNRLIPDRQGADLNMDAVFKAAKDNDTVLEINANPRRLDLEDIYARRAIDEGIKLTINTDAHHPEHMNFLGYGVATARRGWVTKEKVINTWTPEKLVKWLKGRGK
ncbi:MAG: DNA polymerase/3'-5' exonuclease PolX [Chloroflexota bacterium]